MEGVVGVGVQDNAETWMESTSVCSLKASITTGTLMEPSRPVDGYLTWAAALDPSFVARRRGEACTATLDIDRVQVHGRLALTSLLFTSSFILTICYHISAPTHGHINPVLSRTRDL